MSKKDLEKLKRQAEEGKTKAMFEYGIEIDEPAEQKKYLKKAATDGYIPAMYHYGMLI